MDKWETLIERILNDTVEELNNKAYALADWNQKLLAIVLQNRSLYLAIKQKGK